MKKLVQALKPLELLGIIFLGINSIRDDDEPSEVDLMLIYLQKILDRSKDLNDAKDLLDEIRDLLKLTKTRGKYVVNGVGREFKTSDGQSG